MTTVILEVTVWRYKTAKMRSRGCVKTQKTFTCRFTVKSAVFGYTSHNTSFILHYTLLYLYI